MFFGKLIYVCVLLINAIAVLSEDRFLARVGLAPHCIDDSPYGPNASVKARLVNLISSVRTLMRIPLIPVNIAIIIYALVLG